MKKKAARGSVQAGPTSRIQAHACTTLFCFCFLDNLCSFGEFLLFDVCLVIIGFHLASFYYLMFAL